MERPHGQAPCSDRADSKGLQSKGKRGVIQRGHLRQGTVLEETQVTRGPVPGLVRWPGHGVGVDWAMNDEGESRPDWGRAFQALMGTSRTSVRNS